MKHIIALFAVVLAFCGLAQAQTQTEPITVSGNNFYLSGEEKSLKELKDIMMCDPISYVDIYVARECQRMAHILGYTGLSCIGAYGIYHFSRIGFNFKPSTTMQVVAYSVAAVGVALTIDGIIYGLVSHHRAKKAVKMYNSRIQSTSFWDTHDLKVGFMGNGVGLALCF